MKNVFKAGKSFLRQRGKNRNLFFAIAVLLLLFLLLQGQLNQLYAVDAQPPQKEVVAYPETPEGVVKAFIKWRISSSNEACENLIGYMTDGNAYLDKACGGGMPILSRFNIIERKEGMDLAEVVVKHFFCGWCANDGSCDVKKSEKIGSYKLLKGNKWKIKDWYYDGCRFPCDGWLTIDEAIRITNDFIQRTNKDLINRTYKDTETNEELKREIKRSKQLIKKLKQCKEEK